MLSRVLKPLTLMQGELIVTKNHFEVLTLKSVLYYNFFQDWHGIAIEMNMWYLLVCILKPNTSACPNLIITVSK